MVINTILGQCNVGPWLEKLSSEAVCSRCKLLSAAFFINGTEFEVMKRRINKTEIRPLEMHCNNRAKDDKCPF